jgi:hypothetical protein
LKIVQDETDLHRIASPWWRRGPELATTLGNKLGAGSGGQGAHHAD